VLGVAEEVSAAAGERLVAERIPGRGAEVAVVLRRLLFTAETRRHGGKKQS